MTHQKSELLEGLLAVLPEEIGKVRQERPYAYGEMDGHNFLLKKVRTRLEAYVKGLRFDEDMIGTILFHWVGIELAEHRSIDMHDEENRTRLAKALASESASLVRVVEK